MTFWRSFFITLAVILSLAAAFLAGYLFNASQSAAINFPLLVEAYNIIKDRGFNDIPPAPALEYGMIRGMLQAYNEPHTIFLEPPQQELETNALEGKYGGIGVQMGNDEQGNWVLFPVPNSPASQAGILEGDRLLGVDDLAITPQAPADTIQSAIRGPVGKSVTIVIGRAPDYAPISFKIKRTEIQLPSITWHLEPSEPRLGIIKVNLIAATTPDEILSAVKDLEARDATHFAMDLRDNPGGLLDAGVEIARLFLRDGIVIQQQYRGRSVDTFDVNKPGPLVDIPLVVLINTNSASASEITAGALQNHHRALLIGTPSFGKDTIQLIFTLRDKSSLHVTAAHWWIPGLEFPVNGHGLQPDILVESQDASVGIDPVIKAAISALFDSH